MRESAWLAQLQLLASLPYAQMTLAPALCAAVRSGFKADFATLGWCEGETSQPTAFYSERMTPAVLRWMGQHPQGLFDLASLEEQKRSGGEIIRTLSGSRDYLRSPAYSAVFEPMGARWSMAVPLWSRSGQCTGVLYLHRSAAAGPFTDAEQARLRQASERLCIERPPADPGLPPLLPPLPRHAVRSAMLRVNAQGRICARSANAYELLFIGQGQRWGLSQWDNGTLEALPQPVAAMVQRLLGAQEPDSVEQLVLELPGGTMEFRAQRLVLDDAQRPEVVLVLSQLEPADLAVARRLMSLPLSPREKRLLVGSTRHASHKSLADAMGCTVGTLKGYIHGLQAKLGVSSREEFITQLLRQP